MAMADFYQKVGRKSNMGIQGMSFLEVLSEIKAMMEGDVSYWRIAAVVDEPAGKNRNARATCLTTSTWTRALARAKMIIMGAFTCLSVMADTSKLSTTADAQRLS